MWDRINREIKHHCSQCPDRENCLKQKCVVYRIKGFTLAIFDDSKINIDDFFENKGVNQISLFDLFEEGEI